MLLMRNMALTVCDVSLETREIIRKFRFRKSSNNLDAIVFKVDREKGEIVLEEEFMDIDIESLKENLPDHQPRFLLLSYQLKIEDRVSYPLIFLFISPRDVNPELQMMYAGSKLSFQKIIDCGKVFELRELEDFSEDWLLGKLK